MELNDFLDNIELNEPEEPKELVKVDEGQLIIAQYMKEQLINFELVKKAIDKQQKEYKSKIEEVMRTNGITKYESNDKTLMITLGEDSTTETVDKDKLFLKYPDVYRDEEIVKESKRKGSLKITIRESEENDK